MKYLVIALICLPFLGHGQEEDKMTNVKMWRILNEKVEQLQGDMGNWQFMMRQRPVVIITDPGANRMRIMTPIVEESDLEDQHFKLMLEANFDRALDSKYALYNAVIWSVFTHPLEELKSDQFLDALDQVVTLSENFGSSYSSTNVVFGGN